jgi:hypothetical protein
MKNTCTFCGTLIPDLNEICINCQRLLPLLAKAIEEDEDVENTWQYLLNLMQEKGYVWRKKSTKLQKHNFRIIEQDNVETEPPQKIKRYGPLGEELHGSYEMWEVGGNNNSNPKRKKRYGPLGEELHGSYNMWQTHKD